MLRAYWRFSLTRQVRDAARNDGRRSRCLRGTAPENMRVFRIRGWAESTITSQWDLPRQGPSRRQCRGSVGTLDILLQPIALEGAIDRDHDCSFVFGDTGTVHGAERSGRDAAHDQRCGRGFEIEGEYAAHVSLSNGVNAAPGVCERDHADRMGVAAAFAAVAEAGALVVRPGLGAAGVAALGCARDRWSAGDGAGTNPTMAPAQAAATTMTSTVLSISVPPTTGCWVRWNVQRRVDARLGVIDASVSNDCATL